MGNLLLNSAKFAPKQCGQLGQVSQPWLATLAMAETPTLQAFKVLLNATKKVKYHKEVRLSLLRRLFIFKVRSIILQSSWLVILKLVILKTLEEAALHKTRPAQTGLRLL